MCSCYEDDISLFSDKEGQNFSKGAMWEGNPWRMDYTYLIRDRNVDGYFRLKRKMEKQPVIGKSKETR